MVQLTSTPGLNDFKLVVDEPCRGLESHLHPAVNTPTVWQSASQMSHQIGKKIICPQTTETNTPHDPTSNAT